jgi:hypothetical protein
MPSWQMRLLHSPKRHRWLVEFSSPRTRAGYRMRCIDTPAAAVCASTPCIRYCAPGPQVLNVQSVPAYRRRALRAAPHAPFRVAAIWLRSLTPPAFGGPPTCALRLPVARGLLWWGWLAVPLILSRRSRRQGLRAPCALAAVRPSSNL